MWPPTTFSALFLFLASTTALFSYGEAVTCYSCMSVGFHPNWNKLGRAFQPQDIFSDACHDPIKPSQLKERVCKMCVSVKLDANFDGKQETLTMRGCQKDMWGVDTGIMAEFEASSSKCGSVPLFVRPPDGVSPNVHFCACKSDKCNGGDEPAAPPKPTNPPVTQPPPPPRTEPPPPRTEPPPVQESEESEEPQEETEEEEEMGEKEEPVAEEEKSEEKPEESGEEEGAAEAEPAKGDSVLALPSLLLMVVLLTLRLIGS